MNITLIQGEFGAADTLGLLTQMIQIKIKYHENKITGLTSEEDIKARESKIKKLQHQLSELREKTQSGDNRFKVAANITIE